MPSPFPGMDPYLERYWGDVHHRVCTYVCDALQPHVRPQLLARVEERLVIESERPYRRPIFPDVLIESGRGGRPGRGGTTAGVAEPLVLQVLEDDRRTEGFISIVDPKDGNRLVTVVEFLSPTNKQPGRDQDAYWQKQVERRDAGVTLVEVDLLRAGRWTVRASREIVPESHQRPYRACVRRGWGPTAYEFYHMPLRARLDKIAIPLRDGDRDAVLDLQAIIDQAYVNGAYDSIKYDRPADPPLDADDAAWAEALLIKAGVRKPPGGGRRPAATRPAKPNSRSKP